VRRGDDGTGPSNAKICDGGSSRRPSKGNTDEASNGRQPSNETTGTAKPSRAPSLSAPSTPRGSVRTCVQASRQPRRRPTIDDKIGSLPLSFLGRGRRQPRSTLTKELRIPSPSIELEQTVLGLPAAAQEATVRASQPPARQRRRRRRRHTQVQAPLPLPPATLLSHIRPRIRETGGRLRGPFSDPGRAWVSALAGSCSSIQNGSEYGKQPVWLARPGFCYPSRPDPKAPACPCSFSTAVRLSCRDEGSRRWRGGRPLRPRDRRGSLCRRSPDVRASLFWARPPIANRTRGMRPRDPPGRTGPGGRVNVLRRRQQCRRQRLLLSFAASRRLGPPCTSS
jgi:hypothetical protein